MTIKVTYNVTDVYMSQSVSPVYITVSYSDGGASGGGVWGSITGTLSNQTDLQSALDAKLDKSTIDGGTEGQILSKASGTDFDFAWINNYAKYLATNVRNQTGSTIGAFQVVYISGATGNKPLISLADADTEATSSKTYGVTATAIANNGTGDVVTAGELSGINTSAFNEGDLLWLSTTAGGVVTSPPAEPAHAVFIGYVVRSHPTLGVIDVSIQNGYELNELHGVQITTPTNNQGLFYNSSNSLWENKSIATVLGYTPEQPLTFNSPLSRAGNVVSIPQATGSVNGFLSATDWTTFNSKQAALGFTPANAATTLTINGVTFDLSTSRTWNISTGISGSGAAGQVTYWTGASDVSGSNNLFWDNNQARLGIATNTPSVKLHIVGTNEIIRLDAGGGGNNAYLNFNDRGFVGYNPLSGTDIIAGTTRPIRLGLGGWGTMTPYLVIYQNTGNVGIGFGATDPAVRFGVVGDTLLRGSGNTSATTALTVQNSSSTNLFSVRNDGAVAIGSASYNDGLRINRNPILASASSILVNTAVQTSVNTIYRGIATSVGLFGSGFTLPNLSHFECINDGSFTAGVVTNLYGFRENLGTYVATNVYGFYGAIPAASGRWNLYMNGTADNYLAGDLGIGTTSVTNWLNIAASTTAKAHINLASGVAPTSPANGDIWFDGTDIKMRIGGVTKTFTLL